MVTPAAAAAAAAPVAAVAAATPAVGVVDVVVDVVVAATVTTQAPLRLEAFSRCQGDALSRAKRVVREEWPQRVASTVHDALRRQQLPEGTNVSNAGTANSSPEHGRASQVRNSEDINFGLLQDLLFCSSSNRANRDLSFTIVRCTVLC